MVDLGYKPSGFHPQTDTSQVEGLFAERFMELCQDAFARVYRQVSEQFWDNSVYAYQRRPYYTCNFDVGFAEYYVPTCLDGEGYLHFHRIVISLLPELEKEIYDDEVRRHLTPFQRPMGFIDSHTIFVVAPKPTAEHKRRVRKERFKAMLKIYRPAPTMVDTLCIPIINSDPEIAFKKLMTHISNFWNHRVKRLLETLKIQPYQYDYKYENLIFTITVIENYNSNIKHNLKSMVAHLLWFMGKLKEALKRIGTLNILKSKVLPALKELVSIEIPQGYRGTVKALALQVVKKVDGG